MSDFVTIKQFAEARNISTAAVYKRLQTSYKDFITVENGVKGFHAAIFDRFPPISVDTPVSKSEISSYKELIDELRNTNTALRDQIRVKDEQIAALTSALVAAQQSIQAEQTIRAGSRRKFLPFWKRDRGEE